MVTVDEASRIIFSQTLPRKETALPIEKSTGRVLAEQVKADCDFPPFDRVAMDGIAILYASFGKGQRIFSIEGVQAAGEAGKTLGSAENCLEVMTGAVLPAGTDTVIRYEDISVENGSAIVQVENVLPSQNVHRKGRDAVKGQVLLEPGIKISPAEVALFAATGRSRVTIFDYPRTALISSGDELVAIDQVPEPHQIRRSNVYALQSAMDEMGWQGNRYHFRDNKEELLSGLKNVLAEHDVVILSGGVSKGKFDFIPEVLEANGIEKKFHQVSQRPGKPFWFGVSSGGKTVFALPGNPVSTYMCFYRYIKPWMEKSMGIDGGFVKASLGADVDASLPLTYFLQVSAIVENGMLTAFPCPGGGSGDFSNLRDVTGFLEMPSSTNGFRRGELFPYIPFR